MSEAGDLLRAEIAAPSAPPPAGEAPKPMAGDILRREITAPDLGSMVEGKVVPPGPRAVPKMASFEEALPAEEKGQAGLEQKRQAHYAEVINKNGLTGGFDPSSDIGSRGAAFLISRMEGKSNADVGEQFRQIYPKGEIVPTVDMHGNRAFLYKTDAQKDQNWKEFNGGLAGVAGKVTTPQVAGGIGAGVAASTAGLGAVPAAVATGAGIGLGSLAEWGINRLGGLEQNVPFMPGKDVEESALGRATGEATLGGLVQGATDLARAAPETAKRITSFALKDLLLRNPEYGKEAVAAAERQGLRSPMIGQVTDDPKLKAVYGQVSRTSPIIGREELAQKQSIKDALERHVEQNGFEGTSQPALQRLVNLQEYEIEQRLINEGGVGAARGVEGSEAGANLQEGIKKYEETSAGLMAKKYDQVDKFYKEDEGHFNIIPLKKEWEDIKRGVIGPGADPSEAIQLQAPGRALSDIGERIEKLSPDLQNYSFDGKTDSALKQMTVFRDQLEKAAQGKGADAEYAKRLLARTNEILDTPIGVTSQTATALKEANAFAEDRAQKLGLFKGTLGQSDPGALAERMVQPNNLKTLSTLKDVAPDQFSNIVDNFRYKLYSSPEKITEALDRFKTNQKTLDLIMPPEEQAAWRNFGQSIKNVQSQRVQQTIEQNVGKVQGAVDTALNTGGEELTNLINAAGGPDSKFARSVKAGVYQHLLDQATETMPNTGGRTVINPTKLRQAIDDLTIGPQRRRLEAVLTDQDFQNLRDFATYAGIDTKAGGGQAGMQAGALTERLRSPLLLVKDPGHWALAAAQLYNNRTFATILSQPASSKLLLDSMKEGPTPRGIRMLAGAGSTAVRDFNREPKDE